jgi:hypothetical protein
MGGIGKENTYEKQNFGLRKQHNEELHTSFTHRRGLVNAGSIKGGEFIEYPPTLSSEAPHMWVVL